MRTALVIGAGRMARVRLEALAAREDLDRRVVACGDPERAAAELGASGVEVVERSALASLAPPAMAFVTSATARHDADLSAALAFGCPVLCEKPLAEDSDAARAQADRATAQGTPLFVAFQRHFEPALMELRRRIAVDALGVLYHLRFTHFDRRPSGREFIAASGGIFKDLLVHDIECALWLTGRSVRSVHATAGVRVWRDYADFDDADTATVLLTLDDGLVVTLHGSRHHPLGQDARVEALGSAGAVAAGLGPATPIEALEAPGLFCRDAPQSFQERFAAAYAAETNAFADFALGRSDRFGGSSAAASVEAIRVAEACERSSRLGRPVELASV